MRYPASEKLEIIQLVERSHLPAKQTLDMLDIPRTTFYRWYARFRLEGQDALRDKAPLPGRIWNRIPDAVRDSLITLALDRPELSPRELAVTFTDSEGLFCLGKLGLPASQGPRSDHQSGLHCHQGGQRVQRQDHGHQSDVADRLHVPEDHRLGLDVSVDDTG